MKQRIVSLLALVAIAVATGCQKESKSDTDTSRAPASASAAADNPSVAVKEDFVEQVQEEIAEDNVEVTVDALEKEITSE